MITRLESSFQISSASFSLIAFEYNRFLLSSKKTFLSFLNSSLSILGRKLRTELSKVIEERYIYRYLSYALKLLEDVFYECL